MIYPFNCWVRELKVNDYVWLVAHNIKTKVLSIELEYDEFGYNAEFTLELLKLECGTNPVVINVNVDEDGKGIQESEYAILPVDLWPIQSITNLQEEIKELQEEIKRSDAIISDLKNDIQSLKEAVSNLEYKNLMNDT